MTTKQSVQETMNMEPSPDQLSYLNNPMGLASKAPAINPLDYNMGQIPAGRTGGNLSAMASPQQTKSAGKSAGSTALSALGTKGVGEGLTKLAGKKIGEASLSKVGLLGKMGKNPTPYGLAGSAAGILGDFIAKKKAKTGGAIGGAGKGVATGAMIGSVIPGLGTAAGAVIGGLIGGIKGFLGGKKKLKEQKAAAAAQQRGLTSIGAPGGQAPWNMGQLGPMSGLNPYAQLQAETEGRYRHAPVTPIQGITPAMQPSNPWSNDGGMGGNATWGG